MADFQETERQLNAVLTSLGGLDVGDRETDRAQIENRLRIVLAAAGQWQSARPADSAAVGRAREQIADSRLTLRECAALLESIRAGWAERYRQELGDRQHEYEKLSDQFQQQRSPDAYRCKRNFEQTAHIVNDINRLNGQLLDLSSQVEGEHAQTLPTPDAGPPMERTDRDPSPSPNRS